MKQRCYNSNNPDWDYYGGRGITVWWVWRNDFEAFYMYIGPKPSPKYLYTLDRINNDGNYVPGNVRWVTQQVQNNNRRKYSKREF